MKEILASLLLLLTPNLHAQSVPPPEAVTLRTKPLAQDLYLIQPPDNSEDGNVVAMCSSDGILLSDTGLPRFLPQLQAAIASLPCPNKNVRYAINTHWHLDHAGGNKGFGPAGALLIAQDETAKWMSADQPLLGSTVSAYPIPARPLITFSNRLTLHLSNGDVVAANYPPSHTGGDVVVRFVQQKVMHIGDIYYGPVFPWVDATHGGSLTGLRRSLQTILKQTDASVFVPGHGDPIGKPELQAMLQMLDESFALVKEGVEKGMSLQQIQARGLTDRWKSWAWEALTESGWISAVYDEYMKQLAATYGH